LRKGQKERRTQRKKKGRGVPGRMGREGKKSRKSTPEHRKGKAKINPPWQRKRDNNPKRGKWVTLLKASNEGEKERGRSTLFNRLENNGGRKGKKLPRKKKGIGPSSQKKKGEKESLRLGGERKGGGEKKSPTWNISTTKKSRHDSIGEGEKGKKKAIAPKPPRHHKEGGGKRDLPL